VHTKKAAAAQKIENRIDELHAEVGGFLYMATVEGLSEKEEKKARATFQLAVI
jgi:Na+/phosphate symporter